MSWIWWIIGTVVVLGMLSGGDKNNRKKSALSGKAIRIDHFHYIDADDYECAVCGARFKKKSMVCPKCGARFTGEKEDDNEFIEEMALWDDDD